MRREGATPRPLVRATTRCHPALPRDASGEARGRLPRPVPPRTTTPDLAATPQRPRPGPVLSALIAVAACFAAYGWTLALPFQLDDYLHVHAAMEMFGIWPDVPAAAVSDHAIAMQGAEPNYLFRPVFWAFLAGICALVPEPFSPFWFHLASVVLHVAVVLGLLALLRRLFAPLPALCGALWFAVHPGPAQAVSWACCGGDLFAALWIVCGMHCALSAYETRTTNGLRLAVLGAGVTMALAIGSKVAALTAPAAVGGAMLPLLAVRWRRAPREVLVHAALFLVPIGAAFLSRQLTLQTWDINYAGGSTARLGLLWPTLQKLPEYLAGMLYPWNQAPVVADLAPAAGSAAMALGVPHVLGVFAIACTLLLVPGLVARPRHVVIWLGIGGAVFLILALPALFHHVPAAPGAPHTNHASRTAYILMLPFATVLAAATSAAFAAGPALRRITVPAMATLLLTFALLQADAMVHVARTELAAGAIVRQHLTATEAVLAENAAENGTELALVVIDPHSGFAEIPLILQYIEDAHRPPFRREFVEVHHLVSRDALVGSRLLQRIEPAVRILEIDEDTGNLEPRGPRLPAIGDELPALRSVGGSDVVARFRPEGTLACRAVDGVRITCGPGDADVALEFTATAGDTTVTRDLVLPASTDGERTTTLLTDESPEWVAFVFSADTPEFALRVVDAAPAADGSARSPVDLETLRLELLPEDRTLRIEHPVASARFSLGDLPTWTVADVPPETAFLRFRFDVQQAGTRAPMVFVVPRERIDSDGTTWRWNWLPRDPGSGEFSWLTFATLTELWDSMLLDRGVRELSLVMRVEALHAGGESVAARSPWQLVWATR
jgi:hypothetical protein